MDIFISYAHIDNLPLQEGHRGWIDDFHEALQKRVLQWLGSKRELEVWRDPKLAGNDMFSDEILQQLRDVRVLVSVLSPRYVNSEWCARELDAFYRAAEQSGGITVAGNKTRLFKVMKMPVPPERMPEPLQPLLGYEFFRVDPASGKVRELHEMFGEDAETEFWLRLDDLAQDVAGLLNTSLDSTPAEPTPGRPVVYLAFCTQDLAEEQAAIRRELESNGFSVVPRRAFPLVAAELEARVRGELGGASLAVILVGKTYGFVPEGGTESVAEVQAALAAERSGSGALTRLIWIPPGIDVEDRRQLNFIERLRSGDGFDGHTDLLETRLEDLKTVIHDQLAAIEKRSRGQEPSLEPVLTRVYLICDALDLDEIGPLQDALFDRGLEPVLPVFEGDEAEIRQEHEETLRTCDAVLVYYGNGTDLWLSRKSRELDKVRGQGRTRPLRVQGIFVAPPSTPPKERLRTRAALVIRQTGEFSAECLDPFLAQLEARRGR